METVTEVVKNMAGGEWRSNHQTHPRRKRIKRKMWSVCAGNHSAGIFPWLSRT